MTSDMQNSSPANEAEGTTQASRLPVRGLAMILIAVAVLLAAWALWSLTGNDDDTAATAANSEQAQGSEQASDPSAASQEPADGENATNPADPAGNDAGRVSEPAAPTTNLNDARPVTTLHVLNNSTVSQLAARVADQLNGDFETVESGNLADITIPQTTVYFTKGNPEAETAARELADRVGGIAMERMDTLPEETTGDGALVLVLTEDINL